MADPRPPQLPFREAIDFMREKVPLPTGAWTDIWQSQHDRAFVVAGANRDELVGDFFTAIQRARTEGTGYAKFLEDFDRIVKTHGWSYNGSRGWRSRVIYKTNMETSYQAGRLAQMKQITDRRPWWVYHHSDFVADPRPHHVALDGKIFRHDDPFWSTHYPPNGWGCRCRVFSRSDRDLERLGVTPDATPEMRWVDVPVGTRGPSPRTARVPEIKIDGEWIRPVQPGWAYQPGRAWVEGVTPPPLDGGLLASAGPAAGARLALPPARSAPAARILPVDLPDQEYIERFLREFGVVPPDRQAFWTDLTGELLVISDALFRDPDGTLKLTKRGRQRNVLLYADTIKSPDEIRVDRAKFPDGNVTVRRRYIARWIVEGQTRPTLAVFETGPAGWTGVTAHDPDAVEDLEWRSRQGRRIWVREEQ